MDRNTAFTDGELFGVPCEAGAVIDAGHVVCVNAAGFAIAGAPAADNTVIGVSDDVADNTGGAQGAYLVMVRRNKAFALDNDTAAPVTQALVGKDCYLLDSHTVTSTDNSKANPVAGKVLSVSPEDGVLVLIG
ncbi:hypothetical protein FGS43_04520 [Salmonella enterica]|uniref:hypothetical protein n=1 Tax=Salmonella enterica TaxID=28901 RepID=UPI0009AD6043|nr:hypothetical protein [Salmonella enterica]EDT0678082.1 hypothetical protein [Salmonella enterica subsp. enterica serovar Urbana]EEN1949886.1 hypothetical protein [Salmonella enterica subsp. enterica serovar Poona]EHJ0481420.1 hypothetical protein [Salmonella enterica subsp. enterica serovar Abaetetuba]EAB4091072.1 hypothetical protein [Salmonella enterica]EAM7934905.1 hypothetical protein [Salmonella enterica]